MFALSETSSVHMISVCEDVISKTRNDLVDTGELDETVLRELQTTWKRKMIQAGLIDGSYDPIPTPTPLQTPDLNSLSGNAYINEQSNPSMDLLVSPKREHDGFYIPQHDGANNGDIVANDENENDDEILNEDDDDEEDAIDDDTDIPHLVMCQFDKVKRSKNKWDCTFKSGIMEINGKNIIFSKADGVFNF